MGHRAADPCRRANVYFYAPNSDSAALCAVFDGISLRFTTP
jgi:hypothetical protein